MALIYLKLTIKEPFVKIIRVTNGLNWLPKGDEFCNWLLVEI